MDHFGPYRQQKTLEASSCKGSMDTAKLLWIVIWWVLTGSNYTLQSLPLLDTSGLNFEVTAKVTADKNSLPAFAPHKGT